MAAKVPEQTQDVGKNGADVDGRQSAAAPANDDGAEDQDFAEHPSHAHSDSGSDGESSDDEEGGRSGANAEFEEAPVDADELAALKREAEEQGQGEGADAFGRGKRRKVAAEVVADAG